MRPTRLAEPSGFFVFVRHVRQLQGESLSSNLMDVKYTSNSREYTDWSAVDLPVAAFLYERQAAGAIEIVTSYHAD